MDTLQDDSIGILKEKIRRVLEQYGSSAEQLKEVNRENEQLKATIRSKEEELKEIKKKYNTLKLAKSLKASEDDKHDVKIRVNQMVREIDKCIALLNR